MTSIKYTYDSIFRYSEEEFKYIFHTLDKSSQTRIRKLQDPSRQRESILARHLVHELGLAPFFCISHQDGICAAVVSDQPVGIDIAPIRSYRIRSICTPQEWQWAKDHALRCTMLLTAKEAAFKLGLKDPDCLLLFASPLPGFLLCIALAREA